MPRSAVYFCNVLSGISLKVQNNLYLCPGY